MGAFDICADQNDIRNGYVNVLNQLSTLPRLENKVRVETSTCMRENIQFGIF